jgi:hypothetical protein
MPAQHAPDTRAAMQKLIGDIRTEVPFDMPTEQLCTNRCVGCPKKLMEYLDMTLEDWTCRLDDGEVPDFGDISKLAKSSLKIHRALEKNNLVQPLHIKH